jgi:hypothetical protein
MTWDLEDRDRTEYNRDHIGRTRTDTAEVGMDWTVTFLQP